MRTLNIRLLAILMVATLAVGGLGVAMHSFQCRRHAEVFLRHAALSRQTADECKARGDSEQALSELKDAAAYLQRYAMLLPNACAPQMIEMGEIQIELGNVRQAIDMLSKGLLSSPNRQDIRLKLAELLMKNSYYNEARNQLEYLLRQPPGEDGPDRADLLDRLADCHLALGESLRACEALQEAIDARPERVDLYLKKSIVLERRLNQKPRALAVLNTMVLSNPELARAYVLRGINRMSRGTTLVFQSDTEVDEETAVEVPDPAVPPDPGAGPAEPETGDSRPRPNLAADGTPIRYIELAMEDARRALELAPDDLDVLQFAAACCNANGQREEAVALARRGLERYPRNTAFYAVLAEADFDSDHPEEAQDWLNRGFAVDPDNQDLLWILCRLQVKLHQLVEADETLARLKGARFPTPLVRFLETALLIDRGNWEQASDMFWSLRTQLAGWPDLQRQSDLSMLDVFSRMNRLDLQLSLAWRLAEDDYTWAPGRLAYAECLQASGRIEDARDEYAQLASRPDAAIEWLRQLARLTILATMRQEPPERDWSAALAALERLEARGESFPLWRAQVLLGQGETDKARELLEAARDRSPETLIFRIGLVTLAERAGDKARAIELLDQAQSEIGDSLQLRLARLRQVDEGNPDLARAELLRLARPGETFSPADNVALVSSVIPRLAGLGALEEARTLCAQAAGEHPDNAELRWFEFQLARQAGQMPQMLSALGELKRIEGEGPLWRHCEAARLTIVAAAAEPEEREALYTQARQHLNQARQGRPAWPEIPVALARLHGLLGDRASELEEFLLAIQLGDRSPQSFRRAAALLYDSQRYADADALVRRFEGLGAGELSTEMLQMAGELSLRLQDGDRAADLAARVVDASDDPEQQLWAGVVFSNAGRNAEAEDSFRKAIAFDESAPRPWAELIRHFARHGQTGRVDEALAQAEQKIRRDAVVLTMGQILEALDRIDAAEQHYLSALAAAPRDAGLVRRIAEFYLSHKRTKEAQPYLEQLASRQADVSDGERLWSRRQLALALYSSVDREATARALKWIDQNLAEPTAGDDDVRVKAMILSSLPDRESRLKAIGLLEGLLKKHGSDPAPILAEDRFVVAQLQVALGELGKGLEQLHQLVRTNGDEPRFLAFYVRCLLDQDDADEAEYWQQQLELIAPAKAHQSLAFAAYYIRQGRLDEGLVNLERHWEKATPEAVATAAGLMVASPAAEFRYFVRLDKVLDAAVLKFDRPPRLVLLQADVEVLLGRYQEAETGYRALLEASRQDAALGHLGMVVRNNLALLLALRGSNVPEGLRLIDEALAVRKDNPSLWDTRGTIQIALGDLQAAQADLARSIELRPTGLAWFHRAQVQFKQGQTESARKFLEKARQAGPYEQELHPLERESHRQLEQALE